MESSSTARFCVFENAVLDFGKMINLDRPGRSTGTRKWSPGFLSTHCDATRKIPGYFDVSDVWYLSRSVDGWWMGLVDASLLVPPTLSPPSQRCYSGLWVGLTLFVVLWLWCNAVLPASREA